MDESTPPASTPLPPIARPSSAPEPTNPGLPAYPCFGGYRLVQPLLANADGELWLSQKVENGARGVLALLAQDALTDPGAIWRLRQEIPRLPAAVGLPFLTLNPPQRAEDAVNLKRLHAVRPGAAPVAAPPGFVPPSATAARVATPSDPKKKRKHAIYWVVGGLSFGLLVCVGLYAAFIFYFLMPLIKWEEQREKARLAEETASELNDAVVEWAADNNIPDGHTYTWTEISDHAPYHLQYKAKPSGPVDEFGNAFHFPVVGRPVQLHHNTRAILDDKDPDFFWDRD